MQVGQFADVVHFAITRAATEFAPVGQQSCDEFSPLAPRHDPRRIASVHFLLPAYRESSKRRHQFPLARSYDRNLEDVVSATVVFHGHRESLRHFGDG